MSELSDKKIIESWSKNIAPWTSAVRGNEIASRRLVTNSAIVDCVMSLAASVDVESPQQESSVLDIGCGEGWLVSELTIRGLAVSGFDVIPAFVKAASQLGAGEFHSIAYEELNRESFNQDFNICVANFSLLGEDCVQRMFKVVPTLLRPGGFFIVQTLHPAAMDSSLAYVDGWRQGSWEGFSEKFVDPAPWYFRTIESWIRLFHTNNLNLVSFREPVHPDTGAPLSMIIVGQID